MLLKHSQINVCRPCKVILVTIFSSRNSSFFRATGVNSGNDTTEMVAQVKGATVKRAIDLLAYEVLAKFKGECGLVLLEVESVGIRPISEF